MLFALPEDNPKRLAVEKLLYYLNGDWRLQRLQHHCVPGVCVCQTLADTHSCIYAALLECGATLGSDVNLPSAKDWGTVNESAAEVLARSNSSVAITTP